MKLEFQAIALFAAVASCKAAGKLQDDHLAGVAPTDLVLAEAELVVRQVAVDGTGNSTLTSVSVAPSSSEIITLQSTPLSSIVLSNSVNFQTSTVVTSTDEVTTTANLKTSTSASVETEDSSSNPVTSNDPASTTDTPSTDDDSSTSPATSAITETETTIVATVTDDNTSSKSPSQNTVTSLVHSSEHTEAPETHFIETTEATVSTFQTTNSDGQTTFLEKTIDVTHTIVVTKSTGHPAGSLATAESSNGGNSGGGLSTKTRNIIIGVIVGVFGGLILLGSLYMAWKLYNGRRSHGSSLVMEKEVDSILSDETGHSTGGPSGVGRSDPFRQNLDQYHAGNSSKPVINTAANF